MKKLLALSLLLLAAGMSSCEKDDGGGPFSIVDKGTTGPLSWNLTENGVLTISGTGAMPDYTNTTAPWYKHNVGTLTDSTKIYQVNIDAGVTSIGDYAFSYCNYLRRVNIPEGVTSIGKMAFKYCFLNYSNHIDIPASVTSIAENAFCYCHTLDIIVNAKNQNYSSSEGALFNKSKTELIKCHPYGRHSAYSIPDGVTSIGGYAFNGSLFDKVIIPEGVKSIGDYAFSYCNYLRWVNIPEGVTSIGESAFSSSALTSIEFPADLTTIGSWAFSHCLYLTEVTIPGGVASIGIGTFCGCTALTSVTISEGVTSIGLWAFDNCKVLTDVTCLCATPPTLGVGTNKAVFNSDMSAATLHVPAANLAAYKADPDWSAVFASIEAIP